MNLKKSGSLIALALSAFVALPASSFAADGTITFTGNITSQTCKISGNGGGSSFTVTLPTVSVSALTTAKQTAGTTPFNIALTECTPASGTATVYFEPGATVNTTTGQLLNATGSATNVEVGLMNDDFSQIKLGQALASQNSKSASLTSGSATLNYFAQYVATGKAGAGTVNTTSLYSIVYQ